MPDSFPPLGWGPAPFDERDLEALLSGGPADVPFALRPVADALTALCAAPAPAELSGEAAIMAEFSALAGFGAPGLSQLAGDRNQAHTLVLPVPPSDVAPPSVARSHRSGPRHRGRRPVRLVNQRTGALMAAAAAVVIFAAFAVNGNVLSPGKPSPPRSSVTTATMAANAHNSASPNLQGSGAGHYKPPSHPKPSVAAASAQPAQKPSQRSVLCRSFAGFLAHPGRDWRAEDAVFDQLDKLAGGPLRVLWYCKPYVHDLYANGIPDPDGPGSHVRPLPNTAQVQLGKPDQQPAPAKPAPAPKH